LAVSVSPRDYKLRFLKEGFRERRLSLQTRDFHESENIELNAQLEPLANLAPVGGVVTNTQSMPIRGARVELYSASLKRSYRKVSDGSGEFLFPEVEVAPDYRLWVRPLDRYQDYIQSGLEVPAAGLYLPIALEPQGISSLRGQMMDLNGKPVPRFSMWLRSASATVPTALPVTGDGLGYFFVDELPAGKLSFQTNSIPYISVSGIALAPGAEEYVQLTLDWGNYMMAGYVLSSEDEPVPGAEVSLLWLHDNKGMRSHSRRKTVADAGGYFLFNQLGPGLHTLNITALGFYSARREHEVGGESGTEILVQLAAIIP
jgi:hypothetical protein